MLFSRILFGATARADEIDRRERPAGAPALNAPADEVGGLRGSAPLGLSRMSSGAASKPED